MRVHWSSFKLIVGQIVLFITIRYAFLLLLFFLGFLDSANAPKIALEPLYLALIFCQLLILTVVTMRRGRSKAVLAIIAAFLVLLHLASKYFILVPLIP